MKFDFTGKICAVTGAGAGMGQAISLMLAESGAKAVVMVDLSEKHMAETIDKMKAIGTDYKCVYGDPFPGGIREKIRGGDYRDLRHHRRIGERSRESYR